VAKAEPAALGRLFDKSPEQRRKFHEKPKDAAKEAGLPDELVEHFGKLKPNERKLLTKTWDKMGDAGLTHDVDGVTLNFL
jgi:hypothetical protein